MFGSEEAARIYLRELRTIPEITSTFGENMHFLPAVPDGAAFPCLLVYPRLTAYDMPINSQGLPTSEMVSMEVRLIDNRESSDRIRGPAKAQLAYFATNSVFLEEIDGHHWQVTLSAESEIEMPVIPLGTEFYRQLGTVYTTAFTFGG